MVVQQSLVSMNQDGLKIAANQDSASRRDLSDRVKADILEVKIVAGAITEPADLGFSWQISNFTSQNILLKLNF